MSEVLFDFFYSVDSGHYKITLVKNLVKSKKVKGGVVPVKSSVRLMELEFPVIYSFEYKVKVLFYIIKSYYPFLFPVLVRDLNKGVVPEEFFDNFKRDFKYKFKDLTL